MEIYSAIGVAKLVHVLGLTLKHHNCLSYLNYLSHLSRFAWRQSSSSFLCGRNTTDPDPTRNTAIDVHLLY